MFEVKFTASIFRSLPALYWRILLNKIHHKNYFNTSLWYGQNLILPKFVMLVPLLK